MTIRGEDDGDEEDGDDPIEDWDGIKYSQDVLCTNVDGMGRRFHKALLLLFRSVIKDEYGKIFVASGKNDRSIGEGSDDIVPTFW